MSGAVERATTVSWNICQKPPRGKPPSPCNSRRSPKPRCCRSCAAPAVVAAAGCRHAIGSSSASCTNLMFVNKGPNHRFRLNDPFVSLPVLAARQVCRRADQRTPAWGGAAAVASPDLEPTLWLHGLADERGRVSLALLWRRFVDRAWKSGNWITSQTRPSQSRR